MKIKVLMLILVSACLCAAERPYQSGAESALQEMKGQRERYYPAQLPTELRGELMKFYRDFAELKEEINDIAGLGYISYENLRSIGQILNKPKYAYLIHEPELVEQILQYIAHRSFNIAKTALYLNTPIADQWIRQRIKNGDKKVLSSLGDAILFATVNPRDEYLEDGKRALKFAGSVDFAENLTGSNSLHLAVARPGNMNIEWIQMLLQAGANPNKKNDDGETPLDIAKKRMQEGYPGYKEIVEMFLQAMAKNE